MPSCFLNNDSYRSVLTCVPLINMAGLSRDMNV